MGHNICLDIFGGPSDAEAAAGLTAHGEASVAEYAIDTRPGELVMEARLPMAALEVRRTLELRGDVVRIQERVRDLSACDRPYRLDRARDAGAAVSSARRNRVSHQRDAVEGVRIGIWTGRLLFSGSGLRLT